MTNAEKIYTCVSNYGLDEEEAKRIITEDDCVLSIEELRIKYNNPELGKSYPEWLTPTDHYKMCCTTVRQVYNANYVDICTAEELASMLFIKTSLKLNQIKNHNMLKDYIVKQSINIYRDAKRRKNYWADRSLDDNATDNLEIRNRDRIAYVDTESDERECLMMVKSIKNREIRELLILCGYIIGNIASFKQDFLDVVQNSDLIIRKRLEKLLEKIDRNDKINRDRIDGSSVRRRTKKIGLVDVLKITKIDMDINTAREEIGYYLASTEFLPN